MVSTSVTSISIEEDSDTVTVRLDRPESRNALDIETITGLKTVFERLHDESDSGVLLTGRGPVTTAGADTAIVGGDDPTEKNKLTSTIDEVYDLIEHYHRPVVMAAKGAAIGAGLQLAVVSDFAVVGEETVLYKPEIEYGVFSEYSTRMLQHYFGAQAASEVALGGQEVTPEQAKEWGLATEVVPENNVEDHARSMLQELVTYDSGAYRVTKEATGFHANPADCGNYPE